MNYDVAIIGGGSAGLSAAIYAARGGLKVIVFEKGLIGGQITLTMDVENYPGFEDVLSGFDLSDKMRKQALKFGTEIKMEDVLSVKMDSVWKEIKTNIGIYKSKTIIYAAGANPRKLAVEGEERLTGKGVSYCATCDGALYRGKTVAVIGGGDSAVEEAGFLTRFAKKVYIIHRRDELRAVKTVRERAFLNPKISMVWNSVVNNINGEKFVESIDLKNVKTGEITELKVDGVFVYVGIIPNNNLIQDNLNLDPQGFIVTDNEMKTNVSGVYAAGDIVSKTLRQVVTAAADGAIAGFMVERWIVENKELFEKE